MGRNFKGLICAARLLSRRPSLFNHRLHGAHTGRTHMRAHAVLAAAGGWGRRLLSADGETEARSGGAAARATQLGPHARRPGSRVRAPDICAEPPPWSDCPPAGLSSVGEWLSRAQDGVAVRLLDPQEGWPALLGGRAEALLLRGLHRSAGAAACPPSGLASPRRPSAGAICTALLGLSGAPVRQPFTGPRGTGMR